MRLFDNGGVFAFAGLFKSSALGTYQLFATDMSRAVVPKLTKRTVVDSPDQPEDFLSELNRFAQSSP